jgi:hypothetical protein
MRKEETKEEELRFKSGFFITFILFGLLEEALPAQYALAFPPIIPPLLLSLENVKITSMIEKNAQNRQISPFDNRQPTTDNRQPTTDNRQPHYTVNTIRFMSTTH